MEQKWAVRRYREGDEKQILALYETVHGRVKSEARWRWQVVNRPFGGQHIWVAEANERIISYTSAMGSLVKVDNRHVDAATGGDAMTHPNYQRRGAWEEVLRSELEELRSHGTAFMYAHLQNRRSYPGVLKVGFELACELPELRKVCNWEKVLERRVKLGPASKIVGKVLPRIEHNGIAHPDLPEVKVERVSHFNANVDELCKRAANLARVMVVRDSKYLNWRYFERPEYEYAVYTAERSGEALGYIVLRHETEELVRGYILDLLTLTEEEDVATLLFSRAMEHFEHEKVDTIHCWMVEHVPYYDMLRKAGFTRARREVQSVLVVAPLEEDLRAAVTDPQSWYFCMGDQEEGY